MSLDCRVYSPGDTAPSGRLTGRTVFINSGEQIARNGVTYAAQTCNEPHAYRVIVNPSPLFDRFEIRRDDRWAGDSSDVNRSEVSAVSTLPFSTDVWFSYAFRIHSGSTLGSTWHILGQLHDTPDAGDGARSPILSVQYTATGKLQLVTRADPNATTVAYPDDDVQWEQDGLTLDVWHQFVIKLRFERTGNGHIQAWKDGSEIVAATDMPIGYNDTDEPYWKYGLYRGGVDGYIVGDYANMEVGTTSLFDRVANPLTLPADL